MKPAILKSSKNSGQSLIEVLVALAMVAMIILGIVKASTFSVSNSLYSQDQSIASNLAQKKTSEIIALKNSFPLTFFDSPLPFYPDDLSDNERFCTKTIITSADDEIPAGSPAGSKMAKIQITVFWGEEGDGFECADKQYRFQFDLETKITNNQ